jgi:hypothetical protein
MKAWVDGVNLVGSTPRVAATEPLPAEHRVLAVASAIRVFERFSALDGLVLTSGSAAVSVTRADVERLLAPDGFGALRDRSRWPQVVARAIQRFVTADAESGAA